jgi:branched-chain amino acid transport system substrate-binding protein
MANRIINYQTYRGQTFFADCVVVAAKTDYAEGVKIEFVKEFRRRKGNTKAVINFDSDNPDFPSITREVVKIAKGDALAVFVAGYYQDIANFLLALKKQRGFDPQAVKIFACHAANTPEFKRMAAEYFISDGPNKYGLVFPVIASITPDSPDEEIASFARRFYNRFGNYPENFAAHGYDTVKLVADVMDKRGALPRDIQFGMSIVKNWPGIAGKITFDDAHDVSKYPVIYGYDGKHMYIFEPDYKEKAEGYYRVEVWR